ncbi:MAG: hypothetical protein CMH83_22030 [Nocardioides sp.]|nr:hypothetical protein [Nocardioides sp.]
MAWFITLVVLAALVVGLLAADWVLAGRQRRRVAAGGAPTPGSAAAARTSEGGIEGRSSGASGSTYSI